MHIKAEQLDKISGRPIVLSLAGFDPSSGAGITSDIKTIEAHKVYGLGIVTSITIQNDISFTQTSWVDKHLIISQLDCLFERYTISHIKIGLIESLDILNEIINHIYTLNKDVKIIWDPVLRASAGYQIHKIINFDTLNKILKKIYLITPNLEEYSILFPYLSRDAKHIANYIYDNKLCNILLKGGHDKGAYSLDYLIMANRFYSNRVKRSKNFGKHGSGCILSSSIASYLALGNSLEVTTCLAQNYISKTIDFNPELLSIHNK